MLTCTSREERLREVRVKIVEKRLRCITVTMKSHSKSYGYAESII